MCFANRHEQTRNRAVIRLSNAYCISFTGNNGEDIGYRMAKTALNQQSVTFATEFSMHGDKIAVVAVYPGYVATRLSNFRSKNDMKECMDGVVDLTERLGMKERGQFLDWKGETVPW